MRFLIDDERPLLPDKSTPDMIARTYDAGVLVIGLLREKDELYIDHDLGDEDPTKTGYHLLTTYEEFIADQVQRKKRLAIPRKIVCMSSNPPGRDRINQVIASIQRLRKESRPEPRPLIDKRIKPRVTSLAPAPWRKP